MFPCILSVPRRFATAVLATLVGPIIGSLTMPPPIVTAADNWPRLLGPDFSGSVTDTDLDVSVRPTILWSIDVGDGYGIGSVADGRYYHFDAVPQPDAPRRSGRILSRLTAYDMATGESIWSVDQAAVYNDLYGYEAGPRTTPTIDGSQIFTMDPAGNLTCRSIADGQLVWTINTSEKFDVVQNFFGVGGSPLIVGDTVIAMVGGSPPADAGIAPGQLDRISPASSLLVAFDRDDGSQRWVAGNDLASYSSPRTITVGGETLVLIFARDHLWCIDPVDGSVRWKYRHRADLLESVNGMVPVVIDDQIFLSECYTFGSVLLQTDGQTVEEVWKDPPGDRRNQSMRVHWSGPVRKGDFLYGCSGRNAADSDFRCINWTTGEVRWEAIGRQRTSVTRIADLLMVWSERGSATIVQADPEKFTSVDSWTVSDLKLSDRATAADRTFPELTYPCWSAPVVAGNTVLLRGDKSVVALSYE